MAGGCLGRTWIGRLGMVPPHPWRSSGAKGAAVEAMVWSDVETCAGKPGGGFFKLLFTYLVSLNLRGALGPSIAPHELDALLCAAMLSAGAGTPETPLARCSAQVSRRLDGIRANVERLASQQFRPSGAQPLPARALRLGALFQAAAQAMADLVRVLGLDTPLEGGEPAPVVVPEPRSLFANGAIFAALFCAGAFAEGELLASGEAHRKALEEVNAQRYELLQLAQEHGDWVGAFASSLPTGMLRWPSPSERQLLETPADRQHGLSLPIDALGEAIAAHVARNRVTFVTGQSGCGKSVRVPLLLLKAVAKQPPGTPFLVASAQPQPASCLALARRAAGELGEELGATVGRPP
ncbi:unnamed protein product, partial [Prorocentrum cordatum]